MRIFYVSQLEAVFCFCFCCPIFSISLPFIARFCFELARCCFFSGFIMPASSPEMWYFWVCFIDGFAWFVSTTTYPIVIESRRIVFLALAKAQCALILVEDIRWKFSAFSNAAIIVAQHFFPLSSVTQWLIKYNVVFLRVSFYYPKKKMLLHKFTHYRAIQ